MDRSELLRAVGELGFPLFSEENLNRVLAEVVTSKDPRLWEGFPVLLMNKFDRGDHDLDQTLAYLTEEERGWYWQLVFMSLSVYDLFSLPHSQKAFSMRMDVAAQIQEWMRYFQDGKDRNIGPAVLSVDRVRRFFRDYYLTVKGQIKKGRVRLEDETAVEYSLSQIFSPKQKELFYKKLNGNPLTKTEREYFSRTVRKKVIALANAELHKLALQVIAE